MRAFGSSNGDGWAPGRPRRAPAPDGARLPGGRAPGRGFGRAAQRARFKALCELGDFDQRRVLDVGCGLGDLLPFLLEHGIKPFYCGLDLRPEMISRCRARFRERPDLACHFEVGSVLEHRPPDPYDFVVASGLLGCLAPDAPQAVEEALERMLSWCTDGMAVSFPSAPGPRPREGAPLLDPSGALAAALRLTPRVRIRHDYLPNDFTLYLYPARRAA